MAKSLIDLIVLYGAAKASGAWSEARAEQLGMEGNGLEGEPLRDQRKAERKAAGYLKQIQKLIGIEP